MVQAGLDISWSSGGKRRRKGGAIGVGTEENILAILDDAQDTQYSHDERALRFSVPFRWFLFGSQVEKDKLVRKVRAFAQKMASCCCTIFAVRDFGAISDCVLSVVICRCI